MEWLVTSTTGYFLWYHILDQTTDRKKELCDENAYGKLGTPEKELDRQLWFGVCCRRACKYCAVVNFAEPVTQIQKVSQSWMAALDVRDKFLMERAYFYIQVFSLLECDKAESVLAWRRVPQPFNRLPCHYKCSFTIAHTTAYNSLTFPGYSGRRTPSNCMEAATWQAYCDMEAEIPH